MPVKEGYYYTSQIINDNDIPTMIWEEHKIEIEDENSLNNK